MDIKQLKKELGLSNKDLAECFNMSYNSYANSTAKERYENAILSFYKLAKKGWEKNKIKKQMSEKLELNEKLAINYTRCSLQLKEKELLPFEDWLEDKYIKLSENSYQNKKHLLLKDSYQVKNIYHTLKLNL